MHAILHLHLHTYTHTHIHMHACLARAYTHPRACTHVRMHACTHTCLHAAVCTCMHAFRDCTCMHAFRDCTCMHVCVHSSVRACVVCIHAQDPKSATTTRKGDRPIHVIQPYTHPRACTHVRMHACTHTCLHAAVCTCMHAFRDCTCMHAFRDCTCMHVCVHSSVRACVVCIHAQDPKFATTTRKGDRPIHVILAGSLKHTFFSGSASGHIWVKIVLNSPSLLP